MLPAFGSGRIAGVPTPLNDSTVPLICPGPKSAQSQPFEMYGSRYQNWLRLMFDPISNENVGENPTVGSKSRDISM
jgi:hypothetical protein